MSEECHIEHKEIRERLEGISRDLEVHIAETHAHVTEQTIQAWDKEIRSKVDRLADAVMGPPIYDFDGTLHRDDNEGLISKVDGNSKVLREHTTILKDIKHQLGNGIKMQWKTSDKVLVAIIGGLVAIAQLLWG